MSSSCTERQVRRFAATFAGNTRAHGRWSVERKKTLEEAPSEALYCAHLSGTALPGDRPETARYLGVIPIREDNTCYFGAIDLDDDGVDLHELEAKISALELPLVVCRSKSGGAHLYCFLREPVPASSLIDALKKWRKTIGHEKNHSGQPVEIFPKQAKLEQNALGNWINLPYWDHEHTNRYAVCGGRELALDEFFEHAVRRSTDAAGLLTWVDPELGPFASGPICLQTLHKLGFPEGGRNSGLFNVAIFLRAQDVMGWEGNLRAYNAQLQAPIEEDELRQIIRNLNRHETYIYTCDTHPLEAHCKKKDCKKQALGISFFIKKRRLESLPGLLDLVKIKTQPPRYKLKVDGLSIELSAEQLQSPGQFKRALFEHLNVVISQPKSSEWDDVLKDLTENQTEEAAPAEAGDRGLLLMFLSDFLVLRDKADAAEDILRGLPWSDSGAGRVFFRATDFMTFLQRRQFRAFETNELYTLLASSIGLTYTDRPIKGQLVKLWSVPEPSNEQSEPFSIPRGEAAAY